MSNVIVHYALGVTIATLLGERGASRWWWGLAAVAPDVDGLTNLALNVVLNARAWEPWQAQAIAFTLAHRGLAHTIGAIALAAAIAWRIAGRPAAKLTAILLSSHLALDMLSTRPLHPLWPIWGANVHVGLVHALDPIATAASLVAIVILALAPAAQRKLVWIAAAVALVPYAAVGGGAIIAVATVAGTPHVAHFPEYHVVQAKGAGWFVFLVRADGTVFQRTDVPDLDNQDELSPAASAALARAECETPRLGPVLWIDYPTYNVTPLSATSWRVTVTDARALQDGTIAPARLMLDLDPNGVTRVHETTGDSDFHGERDLDLPGAIATHAACAPSD